MAKKDLDDPIASAAAEAQLDPVSAALAKLAVALVAPAASVLPGYSECRSGSLGMACPYRIVPRRRRHRYTRRVPLCNLLRRSGGDSP